MADVAIVGGTPLEYQIDVRPEDLRAYGITLGDLYAAVGKSNMPAGGGVVQKNNAEYIVRGVGWIKDKQDIENTVIKEVKGTPIYVHNIASVQLGTQFRRSVFEKNGNEVTGGAVLMRHGENPLNRDRTGQREDSRTATRLARGRAYRGRLRSHAADSRGHPHADRSDGARNAHRFDRHPAHLDALSQRVCDLRHAAAGRAVFVPDDVGAAAPGHHRHSGQHHVAGRHHDFDRHSGRSGDRDDGECHASSQSSISAIDKVTGDIRELVIEPCRTVGRPIFFSVLIMLLSFVPVFMLSGREGKLFHPLAFTKSFAMIGVALISVTLVPALIPTFIKGGLRSEEENWIVRSFINIYKPLLTWALPRRNLVMWMFAVLLILAAGMFPLQAVVGQGASEQAWQAAFLIVFALVTSLTVIFTRGSHKYGAGYGLLLLIVAGLSLTVAGRFTWLGLHRHDLEITLPFIGAISVLKWLYFGVAAGVIVALFVLAFRVQSAILWRTISLASLVLIGMWAYHFPKIGVAFMPALDEGTTLDMPITVPRASVTESADDLKARDALLRGFPEVESVIGKAGRADTPTDPAPLDMVETFVNFRPKELLAQAGAAIQRCCPADHPCARSA